MKRKVYLPSLYLHIKPPDCLYIPLQTFIILVQWRFKLSAANFIDSHSFITSPVSISIGNIAL